MMFFRDAIRHFTRNVGNDRETYKMASSSPIEDEDLIDLDEDGGVVACVSRLTNVPEASAEELEHLLDVCPPQLEQKLSLTRRQELILKNPENDDILVTLGHDQVIPRRKRIDVVSSETIKRVRDITKNLEPVIQICTKNEAENENVDYVDGTNSRDSNSQEFSNENQNDVTYETQAINNAFDFLTELDDIDDDDDDQPPDKKRRKTSDCCSNEPQSRYPLEPTCFIEDKSTTYLDIDRANREIEATDKTCVIERDKDSTFDDNHENLGFQVSAILKKSQEMDENLNFSNENGKKLTRLWNDQTSPHDDKGRKVEGRGVRKSWSEGESRGLVFNEDKNTERSTSIEIDCFSEPSTSNGITTLLRRSSRNIVRRAPEYSTSSSECSEVDWSWVEEYESPSNHSRLSSSPTTNKNNAKMCKVQYQSNRNTSDTITNNNITCANARPSSAPTRVGENRKEIATTSSPIAGAATLVLNGKERKLELAGCSQTHDANGSIAMSVVGTGKFSGTGTTAHVEVEAPPSLPLNDFHILDNITNDTITTCSFNDILSENSRISGNFVARTDDQVTTRSSGRNRANGTTNSWLRASMRRIRHLRMPDTERNVDRRLVMDSTTSPSASILSGPNSLPDIALIAPEILAAHTNGGAAVGNSLRPSSAPVATRDHTGNDNSNVGIINNSGSATPRRGRRHASRTRGGRSQERANRVASNSARTSNNNNNNTSGENTEIGVQTGITVATSPQRRSATGLTPQHQNPPATNGGARRICERQRDVRDERDNERGEDDDEDENPLGRWPHPLSPALACLGCTLGLFNISRFAILSIQFGANFIVQFLVLSLILGIPLLTLQVCLGQRLAAGAVDMWRISPIFHGVGIALLVAQAFIGIYSIIGVSWMFVYFRDSFITKLDRYRWAEPFIPYRDDTRMFHNTSLYKLHETVPDYFSGVVLQRHHLNEPDAGVVTLKFQVAFNLAVVWMIVFVSLSKGLRSYGKVVYVFTLVPVFGTLVLCTKLLGLTPPGSIHQLFPATVWSEFFINSKSWVAASSEVFLTWGLLGAAAMQVAAHNKHKHLLQRDTSLVVVLTLVVLLLSAFLANTCVQILRHYGYTYTTSSFERISGYTFMHHVNQPPPSGYSNTPERFMSHASFLLGQRVVRPGADLGTESGYQALRLSTELVPATLAILGTEQVSPFWAVLFYFILILFGIAQQLAIWHCVITGIMAINTKMTKLWETTITFFSCACAYILGLPMATELGIYVVYYLDYTVGGAWWIMVLYLVQVGAVFAVRGRPHTGETVVAELFPPTGRCLRHWAGPLLSFTWNVIMPVALMVLSITIFKSSNFRELYVYRRTSRDYWSVWARQLGAAIQLTPILIIPGVAIIQTCRYLNNGPPDIFDTEEMEINCSHCEQCNANRIQLLYRPPLNTDDSTSSQTQYGNDTSTSIHGNGILPSSTDIPFEDPPPKYTPPPSYTTATGARIAKMLRQSFRRSVRRIANVLGETSAPRARAALQLPPPDYATVLVEMNQSVISQNITIHEPQPDVTDTTRNSVVPQHERNRPSTIDRMTRISTIDRSSIERTHSTMDRGRGRNYNNAGSSNLTAADVANLLRSSIRRGASRTQPNLYRSAINDLASTNETMMSHSTTAASVENLVNAAVPINEDSLVYEKDVPLVHDELENDDDDEEDDKKTVNEMDNSVSVI